MHHAPSWDDPAHSLPTRGGRGGGREGGAAEGGNSSSRSSSSAWRGGGAGGGHAVSLVTRLDGRQMRRRRGGRPPLSHSGGSGFPLRVWRRRCLAPRPSSSPRPPFPPPCAHLTDGFHPYSYERPPAPTHQRRRGLPGDPAPRPLLPARWTVACVSILLFCFLRPALLPTAPLGEREPGGLPPGTPRAGEGGHEPRRARPVGKRRVFLPRPCP